MGIEALLNLWDGLELQKVRFVVQLRVHRRKEDYDVTFFVFSEASRKESIGQISFIAGLFLDKLRSTSVVLVLHWIL